MPEFIAVQCCDCQHYQVTQQRKDGKMSCRICGKKQSVRKVLARSQRAAEVRKVVQQLNMARGEALELYEERKMKGQESSFQEETSENDEIVPIQESKWSVFSGPERQGTDEQDKQGEQDEQDEIVTALPDRYAKRKGKRRWKQVDGSRKRQSNDSVCGTAFESAKKSSDNLYNSPTYPTAEGREVDISRETQEGRSTKAILKDDNGSTEQFPAHQISTRWGTDHRTTNSNPPRKVSASRWDSFRPSTSHLQPYDGLQTTLGTDTIVDDEICF